MQTFLPFSDFKSSALVLDNKRTMKQLVESTQILNTLCGKSSGWQHHPAVKMWRGCEAALLEYAVAFLDECLSRGFKVSAATQEKIYSFADLVSAEITYPNWLGNTDFHLSHQSNLLRKDFNYYSNYFPNVAADLPYIWPKNF